MNERHLRTNGATHSHHGENAGVARPCQIESEGAGEVRERSIFWNRGGSSQAARIIEQTAVAWGLN